MTDNDDSGSAIADQGKEKQTTPPPLLKKSTCLAGRVADKINTRLDTNDTNVATTTSTAMTTTTAKPEHHRNGNGDNLKKRVRRKDAHPEDQDQDEDEINSKRRKQTHESSTLAKKKMTQNRDNDQWDVMFDRLVQFKGTCHCLVPQKYEADPKLSTWVETQRVAMGAHQKLTAGNANNADEGTESSVTGRIESKDPLSNRLTKERQKRLEEIGFDIGWSVKSSNSHRNSYDQQWDLMFQRLVAYKERTGEHCRTLFSLVPKRCKEDPKLGTWCDTQRVQKKKLEKKLAEMGDNSVTTPKAVVGRLTDDRIRRLESLGFTWSLRDDWQKHYKELQDFKKQHGHCNVPARYQVNRKLGIWVSSQRQQYKLRKNPKDPSKPKKSHLTEDRIRMLEEMGFCWALRARDVAHDGTKRKNEADESNLKERNHSCEKSDQHTESSVLEKELAQAKEASIHFSKK